MRQSRVSWAVDTERGVIPSKFSACRTTGKGNPGPVGRARESQSGKPRRSTVIVARRLYRACRLAGMSPKAAWAEVHAAIAEGVQLAAVVRAGVR